jgi:hypothetical protein
MFFVRNSISIKISILQILLTINKKSTIWTSYQLISALCIQMHKVFLVFEFKNT